MQADPLSRPAVLAVLQDLVRIRSVNPSLAPDEGANEFAIATFARDWFVARDVRSWLEEVADKRPNAVAEIGSTNGPTLVLYAHLDTVGTAGMTIPPFDPIVEENRVYGRGSYDMKGGAAAVMSAAAALAREKLPGKLLVALVADEEYASIGAQDFVTRHKADGCIVSESTSGSLIVAHKGFVWLEIIATGRAAHGSRWDLGVSAIGKMGRIISALEIFDQEQLRKRKHPLVGAASQHCAMVEGGTGLSSYSEKCRLKVERRTLPGEQPEQVLREIRDVIASAGEQAEIRLLLDRPPLVCAPDAKIANDVRQAIQEVRGAAPIEEGVGSWMDAALFSQAGIPTVIYGPHGAGAHAAVEWVDLDSVVACAQVYASAARKFLGTT